MNYKYQLQDYSMAPNGLLQEQNGWQVSLCHGRSSLGLGGHVQVCFRCHLATLGTQKQCSVGKDLFDFVLISFLMS